MPTGEPTLWPPRARTLTLLLLSPLVIGQTALPDKAMLQDSDDRDLDVVTMRLGATAAATPALGDLIDKSRDLITRTEKLRRLEGVRDTQSAAAEHNKEGRLRRRRTAGAQQKQIKKRKSTGIPRWMLKSTGDKKAHSRAVAALLDNETAKNEPAPDVSSFLFGSLRSATMLKKEESPSIRMVVLEIMRKRSL